MVSNEVGHWLCRVPDEFTVEIYEAPRAHKSYMREIEVACGEIAIAWKVLYRLYSVSGGSRVGSGFDGESAFVMKLRTA